MLWKTYICNAKSENNSAGSLRRSYLLHHDNEMNYIYPQFYKDFFEAAATKVQAWNNKYVIS